MLGIQLFMDGEGSGSGGSGSDAVVQGLKNLLEKHNNDSHAVAALLFNENYQEREKNRRIARELEELKAKVPDGAVVLAGDDLNKYHAYQALGEPETLKTALTERDDFRGKYEGSRRDEMLRGVADASGFKFAVLKDRDEKAGGLAYEVRDETENGQAVKRVLVKYKSGDETKAEPLQEYAAREWADFLPALQTQPARASGTPVIPQITGGRAPSVNTTKEALQKNYPKPEIRAA